MASDLGGGDLLGSTVGTVLDVLRTVFLAWAVNGHFDSNLPTFNLLSIHLVDGLLLQFLGTERDKAKATTFAGFVACLEFLDHEARDRAESDLGRAGLVSGEEFLEL